MIDALLDLPHHLRKRLASALDAGLLAPPHSAATLRSVLGLRDGGEDVVEAVLELERLGISGPAAAAWIRTVEEATSRTPRPDLVWSGPEVPGLHARDTRRVYEELLGSAEHSIWASTYAFFDGPKAFEVLARRMDAKPTLRVTLLLNIQRKRGDTTPPSNSCENSPTASGGRTGRAHLARRSITILVPSTWTVLQECSMPRPWWRTTRWCS